MTRHFHSLGPARLLTYRVALLFALCAPAVLFSVQGTGSTAGAGGGSASAGPYRVDATLGQTATGVSAAADDAVATGFWSTFSVAPIVPDYSLSVRMGQTVRVSATNLLASATDEDGDTLTVTAVSPSSACGGPVLVSSGSVVYTAPVDYIGLDWFTFTVTDSGGDCASGTVRAGVRKLEGTLIRVGGSLRRP